MHTWRLLRSRPAKSVCSIYFEKSMLALPSLAIFLPSFEPISMIFEAREKD